MGNLKSEWDGFLRIWPKRRLKRTNRGDYTKSNSSACFTAYISTETKELDSPQEGCPVWFGFFNKKNKLAGQVDLIDFHNYSFDINLGEDKEDAFKCLISRLISVIEASQVGGLEAIDSIDLDPHFKWKIAFLYQNQDDPKIVNIYSKDMLSALTELPKSMPRPVYYEKLIEMYDESKYDNVAEYGKSCWEKLGLDFVPINNTEVKGRNNKACYLVDTISFSVPVNPTLAI